ncbi:hypothetical protein [Deinococcus arenicola]|uniref:Uncharacterized protein n=1 Tax=Deinococcus arenicola TaxID=2994950 RepID=A0ABU4DLY4_9DEIO|nr:hypothetical protein [Deinococcus sp. ZS9-10]MDV6373446.1 hypothetical protein [Deinococcus sp. ZS9-10]
MVLKFEKTDRAAVSDDERQHLRFQEVSALLGEYGYLTTWNPNKLTHFSLRHVGAEQENRVRVSGRLMFRKDMLEQNLWLVFPYHDEWYLVPHDEAAQAVAQTMTYQTSESWRDAGAYSFGKLSTEIMVILKMYIVPAQK